MTSNLSPAGHVEGLDRRHAAFVIETDERFKALDVRLTAFDEKLNRIADFQAHSDRQLEALIDGRASLRCARQRQH